MTRVLAWLALGSNLGDRERFLATARETIGATPDVSLRAASAVEETPPLGGSDQPAYLNQMLLIETSLPADRVLALAQQLEHNAGRERHQQWASRTLDVDLVRYDSLLCDLSSLTIPHPGLRDRDFWAREMVQLEEYV